jgi:lipopolysaccharide-binding protein
MTMQLNGLSTKTSLFSCLLLLMTTMQDVTSQSPGVILQLSQTGLNYAANIAVDVLGINIHDQKIPDQSGTASVVVGKVDYSVTGVAIKGFTRPSSTVAVNPGAGITWALSNAGISATGGWAYKYKLLFIKISDHGTFDLAINGASASLSVTMGVDSDGRPTISVLGCSCTIASVNVKFHGGASWIYNLFTGFVEKPIKSALQKAVCEAAIKTINSNGAQQLATLKTSVTVLSLLRIDYRLVAPPFFGNNYIQLSHKGEVFLISDASEAPFSPGAIVTGPPNRMIAVYISDYVIDTFGHALQQHGSLSYTLTKDDVPANSRDFFATSCAGTCFGSLVPKAADLYPNSFVELNMRTTFRPTLTIADNSAVGTFKGQIDVVARTPDGKVGNLLSLGVTVSCILVAGIRGNHITSAVTKFSPSVTVISSIFPDIPEEIFNGILEYASNAFIVPKLNEVGLEGFAIPTIDHIDFVGPSLLFINGAVVISTDVSYNTGLPRSDVSQNELLKKEISRNELPEKEILRDFERGGAFRQELP